MTREEELKAAMAAEMLERAKKSAEREHNRQDWLQQERTDAFSRNPGRLH